jgi:hypothetical protein
MQLDDLGSKQKKKKIAEDPNTLFANVEGIKLSLDEAAKAKAEADPKAKENAEKVAKRISKQSNTGEMARKRAELLGKSEMESCIFNWNSALDNTLP